MADNAKLWLSAPESLALLEDGVAAAVSLTAGAAHARGR